MWIRFRIQDIRSLRIWIKGFDEQKLWNFAAKIFVIFVIKNCCLFITRPSWRKSKLQKPSALHRKHPVLKKMKFIFFYCWGQLLLSCIQIWIQPTKINADQQHWQQWQYQYIIICVIFITWLSCSWFLLSILSSSSLSPHRSNSRRFPSSGETAERGLG